MCHCDPHVRTINCGSEECEAIERELARQPQKTSARTDHMCTEGPARCLICQYKKQMGIYDKSEDAWIDQEDKPLPEDEEIQAAFPTRTGRHELYAEAMRLVGARYSKGGLLALVNWLLAKIDKAEEYKSEVHRLRFALTNATAILTQYIGEEHGVVKDARELLAKEVP